MSYVLHSKNLRWSNIIWILSRNFSFYLSSYQTRNLGVVFFGGAELVVIVRLLYFFYKEDITF